MSEYICEELIIEIFTRLPIEIILRFRSLSKSIRSCIDGPHFIRKHTLLSPQKFLIRHRNSFEEGYTFHSEDQLPLYPKRGYIDATALKFPFRRSSEIVGSCNGIICLHDRDVISLWNPSIRRKFSIPDHPSSKSKSPYMKLGFGFDSITCDYKILRMNSYHCERHSYIYSVRRDAWCRIESPATPLSRVISQACFLDGALHWLVQNSEWPKSGVCHSNTYIITFDLGTHVFGSIELPTPDSITKLLAIVDGCIAVISSYGDNSRVWVRRSVDNNTASWSDEYELKLNLRDVKKFVGRTNNGDFLFVTWKDGCVCYNHESGMRSSLKKYGFCSKDSEMCVESLELLNTALPYKEECITHFHENDDMETRVKSLVLLGI